MWSYLKIFTHSIILGFPCLALSADLNTELFKKNCNSSDLNYFNCDFSSVNLYPFSNMHKEEMNFKINFEFKNCNFDQLNIQFNTNKDYFKINLGSKTITLEGYTLRLRDTYLWDTKTNEYDKTCSLLIKNIETSFSNFTKEKISSYFNLINEHKSFIISTQDLPNLLNKVKFYISKFNAENFVTEFNNLQNDLINEKVKFNEDSLAYIVLEEIEFALLEFKNANPTMTNEFNFSEKQNKLMQLINKSTSTLDIKGAQSNINYFKNKLNQILKNAELIPGFNKAELNNYKVQFANL